MHFDASQRRRSVRRRIDVPIQMTVCPECVEQVVPLGAERVTGHLTSISADGARVVSLTFFPRSTRLDLDIPGNGVIPKGHVRARVVSISMVGREPRYGLGLRFEDDQSAIIQLLRQIERSGPEDENGQ